MKIVRRAATLVILVLILLILTFFTFSGIISSFLNGKSALNAEKTIYFPTGTSSWKITEELFNEKIISSRILFYLSYKIYYRKHLFKAGEYSFDVGVKPRSVLEKLINGHVVMHKITIPEGSLNSDIIKIIDAAPVLTGEINNIYPEGQLMPNTYYYLYGERKQAILEKMYKLMNDTLDKAWNEKDSNLPYKNKNELLIMASIIEKESVGEGEMPIIAGVFINRLNKKMKLQADPTAEYALTLGKYKLQRKLTSQDLKIISPFNTYYVRNLPPTPICSPGEKAIIAASKPAKHKYLYFVSNGEFKHNFSENLTDHNKNVLEYRQNKKNIVQPPEIKN